MTVGQLRDAIDPEELLNWQAFFVLEEEEMEDRRRKGAGTPVGED
jgi:hypothetical protein